jgi:hypothetical protein
MAMRSQARGLYPQGRQSAHTLQGTSSNHWIRSSHHSRTRIEVCVKTMDSLPSM